MKRIPFLLRAVALATLAAPFVLFVPTGAQATPPTLTGPDSSWSTTVTVADPHTQASCASNPSSPSPVIEAVCPEFPITLAAPAGQDLHYLDVRLDMSPMAGGKTAEDYDIYLLNSSGGQVDLSANAIGTQEIISVNLIPNGNYTIRVVPFTNLPNSTVSLSARFRTASS